MNKLSQYNILSDLFPTHSNNWTQSGILQVIYPNDVRVQYGNVLTPSQTTDLPTFTYIPNDNVDGGVQDKSYVIVMTDPDAPSASDHKWSEFCHFIDTRLVMRKNESGFVAVGGHKVVKYMGPGPPQGTGLHRYIFCLLEQQQGKDQIFKSIEERANWGYKVPATGVNKWMEENNLKLLAINFFLSEFEE